MGRLLAAPSGNPFGVTVAETSDRQRRLTAP
jgi:hypothetical protein